MSQDQDQAAWSLYWAQDRLHSCVAQEGESDQAVLNDVWRTFAESLSAESKVLDIATGNGAVPSALLAVRDDLLIDAVDKANIDPKAYLKNSDLLSSVQFHAETDIYDMPFAAASFDAITSQFGVEYAGFFEAGLEVMPLLSDTGQFCFIVHHADSNIIASSRLKVVELESLTQQGGLLDTLIEVLRGNVEFTVLEQVGKAFLEQDALHTQAITGQVFAGIETIANNMAARPKDSIELGAAINLRVRSELSRLQQLLRAGQREEDLSRWAKQLLSETGIEATYSPIYVDAEHLEYLLGWQVSGRKLG